MRKFSLAAMVLLAATASTDAATLMGKNLTYCDSNDPKDAKLRTLCWGYVTGFVEGIQSAAQAAKAGKPICLQTFEPDADRSAVRAIINDEEKQQKHLPRDGLDDLSAPLEAANALIAAFPCKKSK